MKVRIKINDSTATNYIFRKVKFVPFGNFIMNIIRYKNKDYLIGDGDEYLRGYNVNKIYTLGKCLTI